MFLDLSLSLGSPRLVATTGHTLREFEQSRTELNRKGPFCAPVVFFLPPTESIPVTTAGLTPNRQARALSSGVLCGQVSGADVDWN